MRLLVLAIVLFACNRDQPTRVVVLETRATVPVATTVAVDGGTPDPWSAPTPVSDTLSLAERAKIADAACPKVTGAFFYEVTKHGKTSHILGTRHISVGLAKFPPTVSDTIDHASQLVFEISPDDRSGATHASEPLRVKLGPKDWTHFEELVGTTTARGLEVGEPTTAALQMMLLYEDLSNTLESQIQERATANKIAMTGLESSEFQDNVLAKLLDFRMLKATIETTKDRAEIQKDSHDDLAQYCAGTDTSPGMDDETRTKLLSAGYTKAELDEQDDILVYKRDADWIPKLSKLFEQDNVFVAVGADHLIGPRGVIALLERQGFTTKRVTK
jgi:uncharacterized protein YbaP (TraB family)